VSRGHAAFDAWYVYDYFATGTSAEFPPQGFAAVPFSEKGGMAPQRAT